MRLYTLPEKLALVRRVKGWEFLLDARAHSAYFRLEARYYSQVKEAYVENTEQCVREFIGMVRKMIRMEQSRIESLDEIALRTAQYKADQENDMHIEGSRTADDIMYKGELR